LAPPKTADVHQRLADKKDKNLLEPESPCLWEAQSWPSRKIQRVWKGPDTSLAPGRNPASQIWMADAPTGGGSKWIAHISLVCR
jgi:hypothetical protein